MILENEIIMLVLGAGLFIFIITSYSRLKAYPSINTLIAGFCLSLLGWTLTIFEGFLFEATLNFAEHFCYLASALCVALWVRNALANGKEID